MIKNAVLHPVGDQPMLADLVVEPQPGDISLMCTNLRTIDGKRPPSIEHPDGVYVIPLVTLRFVEIPKSGVRLSDASAPASTRAPSEDGLAGGNGHAVVPLGLPAPGAELVPVDDTPEPAADADSDATDELIRRIREL